MISPLLIAECYAIPFWESRQTEEQELDHAEIEKASSALAREENSAIIESQTGTQDHRVVA